MSCDQQQKDALEKTKDTVAGAAEKTKEKVNNSTELITAIFNKRTF